MSETERLKKELAQERRAYARRYKRRADGPKERNRSTTTEISKNKTSASRTKIIRHVAPTSRIKITKGVGKKKRI